MAHYDIDEMDYDDIGGGYQRVVIDLGPQDSASNPASTKGPIYGPATVGYLIAPSGSITVKVADPNTPTAELF